MLSLFKIVCFWDILASETTNEERTCMANIQKQQRTVITVEFTDVEGQSQELMFSPEEYLEFVQSLQEVLHSDVAYDSYTDEMQVRTYHQGLIGVSRYMKEDEEYIDMYMSHAPNSAIVVHVDMEDAWQIVNSSKSIEL